MLFLRKRKGQSTAEYAILISLVVAAAFAMQIYVKRGLQSGVKFVVDKSNITTGSSTATGQYEPYYLESTYGNWTKGGYTDTEEMKTGGEVQRDYVDKTTYRTGSQTMKAYNPAATDTGSTVDQ